jgi:hypothetical protein
MSPISSSTKQCSAVLQELNIDLAVRKSIESAFVDGRIKKTALSSNEPKWEVPEM